MSRSASKMLDEEVASDPDDDYRDDDDDYNNNCAEKSDSREHRITLADAIVAPAARTRHSQSAASSHSAATTLLRKPKAVKDDAVQQRLVAECTSLQLAEWESLKQQFGADRVSREVQMALHAKLSVTGARLTLQLDDEFLLSVVLPGSYPLRDAPVVQVLFDAKNERTAADDAALCSWRLRLISAVATQQPFTKQPMLAALFAAALKEHARVCAVSAPKWQIERPQIQLMDLSEVGEPVVDFAGKTAHTIDVILDQCTACMGATATHVGGKMIFIGGVRVEVGRSEPVPSLVRVFDFATRSFSFPAVRGVIPKMLVNHASCRAGQFVVSVGGHLEDPVLHQAMFVYDTVGVYGKSFAIPLACTLQNHTLTRVGDFVYVFGGAVRSVVDSSSPTAALQLDDRICTRIFVGDIVDLMSGALKTPKVEHLSDRNPAAMPFIPTIRSHTATLIDKRYVFLHGGVIDGAVSARSWLFDCELLHIVPMVQSAIPSARTNHSAVVLDRFIVFVGGRTAHDTYSTAVDLFDCITDTWHHREVLGGNKCREQATAVAVGNRILMFDGATLVQSHNAHWLYRMAYECAAPVLIDVGLPQRVPPSTLGADLAELLASGEFSDIEIGGRALHRAVLAARCPQLLEPDVVDVDWAVVQYAYSAKEGAVVAFGALFDDDHRRELYADLTFVCGDERIGVSRALVLPRAPLFRRMLGANMCETKTGEIRIGGDASSAAVRTMLRFLYCGRITLDAESALELLPLADAYQLWALKARIEEATELTMDWDDLQSVVSVFEIAHTYRARALSARALKVLAAWPASVVLEQAKLMQVSSDAMVELEQCITLWKSRWQLAK